MTKMSAEHDAVTSCSCAWVLFKNDLNRDYEGQAEEAFQALARFPSLRPTGDLDDPVTRPSDPSSAPHFSTTPRRYAPREPTCEKTPGAAGTVA